jgi:thiamine biosynthesis lipoprotein
VRGASAGGHGERYESTEIHMGVPFRILLYAPDETAANAAFRAAFEHVERLNRMMSDYDAQSELRRLTDTATTAEGVRVSDPLWAVLARSQKLAAQTNGAFDVTVGPYVRLWRRARRTHTMPSDERLALARAAVGYRNLVLDEKTHTVRLLKPEMRLDLGGIAIGYAVDDVVRLLRERGIARMLVDASGDVAVGDPPPGKHGWTIGIMPLSEEGTPTRYVSLVNAAVTTSGDALQHVDIDGKRYSHIVDPRTGLGLTNRVAVAVIAPDCTTADSLDTAICVLGVREGLTLIERHPGVAAFIVQATDGEPEIVESKGFQKYVTSAERN